MDKGPDEMKNNPLDDPRREGVDPLAGKPGFDPATDAFSPDVADTDAFNQDVINPDPAAIRAEANRVEIERTRTEIELTRADMSDTVDEIQNRLSPENLKEQAKDRVKEATVGKAQEAEPGTSTLPGRGSQSSRRRLPGRLRAPDPLRGAGVERCFGRTGLESSPEQSRRRR